MANTPPVISYSTIPRKRPWHILWWLLIGDLALGLMWVAAALRVFFSSGADSEPPGLVMEAVRLSFTCLAGFTAAAWVAWLVVTLFRRTRGAG